MEYWLHDYDSFGYFVMTKMNFCPCVVTARNSFKKRRPDTGFGYRYIGICTGINRVSRKVLYGCQTRPLFLYYSD